jgi:UDP-N-acetylmuramoyl-tripeptide--D-alanyl-D-alanine ligase
MNVAEQTDMNASGFGMQLHEAAQAIGARHAGPDVWLQGVSTDTRTLQPGQLFVALRGPNHDGHDYLAEAMARGAAGCLVEQVVTDCPAILVEDTRLALGQLARAWRRRFDIPLVAITGSNGKTTVKEMLAAILARPDASQPGEVLATRGNLNNDIGLPLTLLELDARHRSAVVELGANHAGEIDYLTHIALPDVALITNAGPAHLEGFGSLEGVARAKGEIFAGLADNGTAVINADDAFAPLWRERAAPHRIVTFGLQPGAEVTARWQAGANGSRLQVTTPQGEVEITLALLGQHNVMNALAAIAAATALAVPLATLRTGLESLRPVPGRLELKTGPAGSRLIDDTYNANPASLAAALEVLAAFPGRRILVLGDMAELGVDAGALHAEAGRLAREAGLDGLIGVGPLAAAAAREFGAGGTACADQAGAIAQLQAGLDADSTVLVKGSRASRMERVVAALEQTGAGEGDG